MREANINERSILGNFLPSVYIEKITLESNAGQIPLHNLDPHTSNTSEEMQRFVQENQEIERGKPLGGEPERQPLKVSLDLSIKQKVLNTKNLSLAWLAKNDFKRYFKILVLQSTDPVVSAMLSAEEAATLSLLHGGDLIEFNSAWEAVRDSFPLMDRREAHRRFKEHCSFQVMTISDIKRAQKSRTGKPGWADPENEWTDMDGSTYLDIPFFLSYTLEDASPLHLAYFVVATLDVEAIIDDYELEPDSAGKMAQDGMRTIDVVIEGGRVASEAHILHDRNGRIWAGPTHTLDGAIYAGLPGDSDNPERLTSRVVANNKVQDFRIFDRLKDYSIDVSPIKNMLNNSLFTSEMGKFSRDQSILKEASFWSSLALSKDESENVNYFFSVDMGKIFKQYTKYGHLIQENQFDWALGTMKIRSMQVFRRRVRKVDVLNRLGSPVSAEFVYDNNEEPVLLGTYMEDNAGIGAEVGLREMPGLFPERLGVTHFTGTDSSIKDITYGHYRYEVQLEIEDNTHTHFNDQFSAMNTALSELRSYLAEAMLPKNYDVVTNRFRPQFRTGDRWLQPISDSLGSFATSFNSLKMTGAARREISITDIVQLTRMLHPTTATPHSIGLVVDLFGNLMEAYSQILGYGTGTREPGPDPSVFSLPAQCSQRSPRTTSISLRHHFREVWNSDIPKNFGYNYLDIDEAPLPGINTISGTSLEERANIEVSKFFEESGDVQIQDDEIDLGVYDTNEAKYSVFTPATVNLGAGKALFGAIESKDVKRNDSIVTAIASFNFGFGSPHGGMLGFFSKQKEGSKFLGAKQDTAWGKMAEFGSAPSKNSLVKPTKKVERHDPPPTKKEEFGGKKVKKQFPKDPVEDREEPKKENLRHGPADPPKGGTKESTSVKGAEGLQKFLAQDSIMKATGMNSNFKANGKKHRKHEKKKSVKKQVQEKKKQSASGLMGKIKDRVVKKRGAKKGKSISRSGKKGILSDKNMKARESREVAKVEASIKKGRTKNKEKHAVVEKLPLQWASLLAGDKSKVTEKELTANGKVDPSQSPETFATMIMNYNLLGKLQYFTGYAEGNGETYMNLPSFQDLDRAALISKAGKKLLCRIVRHEDKELGFIEPKGLVMPIYDRYFILDVIGAIADLRINPDPPKPARKQKVQQVAEAPKAGKGFLGFLQDNVNIAQQAQELNQEQGLAVFAMGNRGKGNSLKAKSGKMKESPKPATKSAEKRNRNDRKEKEKRFDKERQNQLKCWYRVNGEKAKPPEPWNWQPNDTDWCAKADDKVTQLTPQEMEYCMLQAKCAIAQSKTCARYFSKKDAAEKCNSKGHCGRFRDFQRKNPKARPAGKCSVTCNIKGKQDKCYPDTYRKGIWIRFGTVV